MSTEDDEKAIGTANYTDDGLVAIRTPVPELTVSIWNNMEFSTYTIDDIMY